MPGHQSYGQVVLSIGTAVARPGLVTVDAATDVKADPLRPPPGTIKLVIVARYWNIVEACLLRMAGRPITAPPPTKPDVIRGDVAAACHLVHQ
jgi:hypothetical protein